ncbi:atrial natriuretic peptide receptor 2-like isoform X2 [Sitophilus oryzae]|uniref:Gamma-aminobutyric acid type B receptor subunit 2 n=1 Tax=Sitophilus oryzae TaxID=7048 RepID=A0A6J2XE89_SITOR|nr:atrial natriuretic peptide receptor 2-like isoform X2 [Sitophilus oryzae]
MTWLRVLLLGATLLHAVTSDAVKEERCLTNFSEVYPKKYFHWQGQSLDVVIETSDRITHQLTSWIFYYFTKEVLGYSRVKVVNQSDDFDIERAIEKLTDKIDPIAKSTINLEVWIPPDYDTYVVDFVKECGSVSPPGRFSWFIPVNLTAPIRNYYNPYQSDSIWSIHWRFFREEKFVNFFDMDQELMQIVQGKVINEKGCPEKICNKTRNMYIPKICENKKCGILLTSYWNSTKFVKNHIEENKLLMKIWFLGDRLAEIIDLVKERYQKTPRINKSLVILSWVPSDVILYEKDFITVSFEHSERLNFTHSIGYKYEMHRLVKVAWSKVEVIAKPLYNALRSFKFEEDEYDQLLALYDHYRTSHKRNNAGKLSFKEIACYWMRNHFETWNQWRKQPESTIYIGGIFPMSPMSGSSYQGEGIVHGALMAVSAINRDKTILADYKMELLITNGMCRADNVMKNFIDFIIDTNYYTNLVGVLGPACSDTVEPLAGVSKYYHIMAISYSAEGSSFSNREKYPYFFRTIGENKHYKHVYLELFKRFKWNRVAALTEDGQKYTEYISQMQDELEQNGITFIANKKFPRERETEPMTRYLEDLREKRARIIIADVVDEIARQVMCEAYKLNMTGAHGYVWFLPMWLNKTWYNTDFFNKEKNESVNCTTIEMILGIKGYFSMTHAYYAPENQTMQENITVGAWLKTYKSRVAGNFSDYAGFAYDAVWTYAFALDRLSKTDAEALSDLHTENTTNKLVKLVEQTDFFGVSGRIKFRGGPSRFSVIQIKEWYNNDLHLIGHFYPNLTDHTPEILGGDLILNDTAIKWFTPDGIVPDDGTPPPAVCAIDSIAKVFNVECQTAIIILNVMVAVFLGFTVMGVCLYLKHKYDLKVQKQKAYMEKLGLTYEREYPTDLEEFEVVREHIEVNRKLGEGAFGAVYGGEAETPVCGWSPVAVKTLKNGSSVEDKIDFLTEADNMKRFDHKNIVKLLGVVTKTQPLHTLMEYCLYGDLKTYLLSRRHFLTNPNIGPESLEEISPKRLTSFALDIARGLSYLSEMRYVHRDLASRNVLINAQRMAKIGDFGMTRPMNDYESYRFTRKGMLPVRWMAPESLISGVFTAASDMWSYGVVLYEIVTFGVNPWYGRANMEVVEEVKNGGCLEVPAGTKPQLEALMKSCWSRDAKERPIASSIVEFLANNPKLMTHCTDVPPESITIDEWEQPSEFRSVRLNEIDFQNINSHNFLRSPKVMMQPPQTSDNSTEESSFQMQSNRRQSDCQDEDEGFIGNSPSNGYINSKV